MEKFPRVGELDGICMSCKGFEGNSRRMFCMGSGFGVDTKISGVERCKICAWMVHVICIRAVTLESGSFMIQY